MSKHPQTVWKPRLMCEFCGEEFEKSYEYFLHWIKSWEED